jgi:hypothetical protein
MNTTTNNFAFFPSVKIPQPDGSVLIRPGRACVLSEIGTAQFAKLTGMAPRTVRQLCDEGKISFRRLTTRGMSKILIPLSELEKFQNLQ